MLARRHWLPQRSRSANFFGQQTSFFSGRAPPSLRRSSFSALPVLSSVSTQGHTTLSTVVALRTLIGARKEEAQPEETPFYAHNEVLLQLYLLVYEVLHLGRCTMKQPGARHMHLKTFQKDVLKVGALIVRHARNIEIRIAFSAVALWRQFWGRYQQLTWVTLE